MNEQAYWYVIHTYSGHENKVKATIEKSVKNRNMEDIIQDVSVPVEEIVEITKTGKKKIKQRKIFPGYCLVKMVVTDESWYIVRNTKGVTGFVGPNSRPIALTPEEVENMGLEKEKTPILEVDFEIGQKVEIVAGAFKDFDGYIESINGEDATVKVKIFMFGDRETLLDLEMSQIRKID